MPFLVFRIFFLCIQKTGNFHGGRSILEFCMEKFKTAITLKTDFKYCSLVHRTAPVDLIFHSNFERIIY